MRLVATTSVAFAAVVPGEKLVKTVTIQAQGGDALITSYRLVKSSLFFLKTRPAQTPFLIADGESLQIEVEYSASVKGVETALVLQCSNCENTDASGAFSIQLRGEGSLWMEWACGPSFHFGTVGVGVRKAESCLFENDGDVTLQIESIKFVSTFGYGIDFSLLLKPRKIAPGSFVKAALLYTPSDARTKEDRGRFEMVVSGGGKRRTILLDVAGRVGEQPKISLVPIYPTCTSDDVCQRIVPALRCRLDAFDEQKRCRLPDGVAPSLLFGALTAGKTETRNVSIRNVGKVPLALKEIVLSDDTPDAFALSMGRVRTPSALLPGQEAIVSVAYTAGVAPPVAGRLVVKSSAADVASGSLPFTVAAKGCDIRATPETLSFRGPMSLEMTLSNVGRGNCVVSRIFVSPEATSLYALLPVPGPDQVLAPGGSLRFLVKYVPQSKEVRQDYLVIESNDPDTPELRIPLKPSGGELAPCELSVTSTINFGGTDVWTSSRRSLRIENHGYGECEISEISLAAKEPVGHTAFKIESALSFPLKCKAGQILRIDLSFLPTKSHTNYEGLLTIVSDDPDEPKTAVKLVGSAIEQCLTAIPNRIDFGMSKYGCGTRQQEVTLFYLHSSKCKRDIQIKGLKIALNRQGEFGLEKVPSLPQILKKGDAITFTLSYTPRDLGVDTAMLEVGTNVPGQDPMSISLAGEGVGQDQQRDVFKQPKRMTSDLAFVVDNSGSMGTVFQSVSGNVAALINWAIRLNVDYHIMVTTMDVTGKTRPAGCPHGSVITSGTSDPVGTFRQSLAVGTSGSSVEQGLEAARQMLSPAARAGCNKGFFRSDSRLSIVFVSNEADQSPESLAFYKRFFLSLRKTREQVNVTSIGGPAPNGCVNPKTKVQSASTPRYFEVAQATGGMRASICQEHWAQMLSDIGSMTYGYSSTFPLRRVPKAGSLVVKVNGVVVPGGLPNGWAYDPVENILVFGRAGIPKPGTTISVDYIAVCKP